MSDRPIFIVGTQRSGTTLLRLILDSHDRIAIGHESGFMRAVEATKNLPGYIYGDHWYRRFGIDDADMNRRLCDFYSSIFREHAHAHDKRRWGEKTPDNIFVIREMAEIFPNAQFIWCVRRPAAVVASLKKWNWSFGDALSYRVTANRIALQAADFLPVTAWHRVAYEDLVQDPKRTLGTLIVYLQEPWSDNLLKHQEVQSARSGGGEVEGDNRDDRPLDVASLDRWRNELSAEEIGTIDEATRDLIVKLGYESEMAV